MGEANILRSSLPGAGVIKSDNGGRTWTHKGLTSTNTIGRIVIHPKNSDIVFVAASGHEWTFNKERGIYKTLDGGKSWMKVLSINDQTGVIDLVMDPANPEILYAASWQRIRRRWSDPQNRLGYQGTRIYRTLHGGKTWEPINEGLPPAEYRGRIKLDVSVSNANVLYAVIDNQARLPNPKPNREPRIAVAEAKRPLLKGGEVYRSENKEKSWKKVSPDDRSFSDMFMYADMNWFAWAYTQLRVDPSDENTVYVLDVNLLKSSDGGKTFTKILYPKIHVDHHALWIDPPRFPPSRRGQRRRRKYLL